MIEVVAKVTAGVHPEHGPIIEGQRYTIREDQFADQLFERVETETEAPAETGKKKGR